MTVLRFSKWSVPVPLLWPSGDVVKRGELIAGEEYVYTLEPDGQYFTVKGKRYETA